MVADLPSAFSTVQRQGTSWWCASQCASARRPAPRRLWPGNLDADLRGPFCPWSHGPMGVLGGWFCSGKSHQKGWFGWFIKFIRENPIWKWRCWNEMEVSRLFKGKSHLEMGDLGLLPWLRKFHAHMLWICPMISWSVALWKLNFGGTSRHCWFTLVPISKWRVTYGGVLK